MCTIAVIKLVQEWLREQWKLQDSNSNMQYDPVTVGQYGSEQRWKEACTHRIFLIRSRTFFAWNFTFEIWGATYNLPDMI